MRKTARLSIMLIAVGIVLVPEAYWAPVGFLTVTSFGGAVREPPMLFLWRGQMMEGNITTNDQINLYVMRETDYLAFIEGQSWQPLYFIRDVSNDSFHFMAPTSGYYRVVANVRPDQETTNFTISIIYHGIDRDHYDAGLAFLLTGSVLGIIILANFLRSKFFSKTKTRTRALST